MRGQSPLQKRIMLYLYHHGTLTRNQLIRNDLGALDNVGLIRTKREFSDSEDRRAFIRDLYFIYWRATDTLIRCSLVSKSKPFTDKRLIGYTLTPEGRTVVEDWLSNPYLMLV